MGESVNLAEVLAIKDANVRSTLRNLETIFSNISLQNESQFYCRM